jgi:dTDP-4-amino-4,6-dideoxygalactose transaminase
MTWRIPLSDLDFGPEEAAAAQRVLQNKWLSMGPETKAFEEEFAAFIGTKHAIAVSNGTAALHLALLALRMGPGDAVIQPAVNFVAAGNMTKAVGATPVFADINSLDEPTISPESISARLSTINSPSSTVRPKAVIVMHYGGYLCRMAEIRSLCQEHGLALIEDACHAVGARYRLGPQDHQTTGLRDQGITAAGNLGDIGCFSFFSNKNLVTGEGGMLTTNRDDIADKVRKLRSHGMSTLTWDRHRGHAATYDVLAHGYNYRLDDLRSALGREQLKKLERNNQRRRELTALYWEKFAPLEQRGWALPYRRKGRGEGRGAPHPDPLLRAEMEHGGSQPPFPGSSAGQLSSGLSSSSPDSPSPISLLRSSSAHLMAVVAPDTDTRWRCAETLKAAGIQTSLHYPFVPGFAAFRASRADYALPNSAAFCPRVITLPLYPTMTEAQVEAVSGVLTSDL